MRDVPQPGVHKRRHQQGGEVEAVGVCGAVEEVGIGIPLMPPKPETLVTWPKKRLAITEKTA